LPVPKGRIIIEGLGDVEAYIARSEGNLSRLKDAVLGEVVDNFVKNLEREIKAISRTGNMLNSITVEKFKDMATVSVDAPYASVVERGARPHIIRPRESRALFFEVENNLWVLAKKVLHPGFRGRYFFRKAMAKTSAKNEKVLKKYAQEFIETGDVTITKQVIVRRGAPVTVYRKRGRFTRAPEELKESKELRRNQLSPQRERRPIGRGFWEEKRTCVTCGKDFWVKYKGDRYGNWEDEYLEICTDIDECEECFFKGLKREGWDIYRKYRE